MVLEKTLLPLDRHDDYYEALLDSNSTLHTIYTLKNRLHEILHSRQTKHEQFIETLNNWSNEAKSHGIDALDDFIVRLRSYKVI